MADILSGINVPRILDGVKRLFALKGPYGPEMDQRVMGQVRVADLDDFQHLWLQRIVYAAVGGTSVAAAANLSGFTLRFTNGVPVRSVCVVRRLFLFSPAAGATFTWGVMGPSALIPFASNGFGDRLDSRNRAAFSSTIETNFGNALAPGFGPFVSQALGPGAGGPLAMIENAGCFVPGDQFGCVGLTVNQALVWAAQLEIRPLEPQEL